MTVWLAGGTGLIGRSVLRELRDDPAVSEIVVFARRAPDCVSPKIRMVPVDFSDAALAALPQPSELFCCLGTTIRAAGSQQAFRAVDERLVLEFASAGQRRGATHFLVITAMGADASSRVFYSRVKGEVEQALRAMAFPALSVLRPSLLLGDRAEFRAAEWVGQKLGRLAGSICGGPLADYRPIESEVVAKAMIQIARQQRQTGRHGCAVFASSELQRLGS